MVITPKHKPVITKGNSFVYNPQTFMKEHAVATFHEASCAEEILDNIKPFEINGRKFVTFDTETYPFYESSAAVPPSVVRRWVGTGKKAIPQDFPFSFQICDGTQAWALYSDDATDWAELKKLAPLLEDTSIEKIAHNTKFDKHMLQNIGLDIKGMQHDTVVLAKLIDENRMSYELKKLASRYKEGITKFEDMVASYKQMNKISIYNDIPRPLLTQYGCADVWNAFVVFKHFYKHLVEEGLEGLYNTEMEVMMALYEMERNGMQTDLEYEKPLKEALQKTVDESEEAVYAAAGHMFNMNSNKQVYEVLMEQGVSPSLLNYTEKGNVKLDKDEMKRLDEVCHIDMIGKILDYKKADKLLNTYANGIYSQVDSEGKAHGSINQCEAKTGRMSITKPALQTIPKKDKRIRRVFIPEQNCRLLLCDLDQIEYRLYAHYSKEKNLLDSIDNGYDVHAATAALLSHTPLEKFMDLYHSGDKWANDWRVKAKTINFALIYGVGTKHLSELLGCSETEATQIKMDYFAALPCAKPFIDTVQAVIKQRGYVKNFYGRRRRLNPDDCYKAPNSLIQGCAADYIKSKLVNIYKYIKYNHLGIKLINIVHDELIMQVPNDEFDEHAPVIRWLMSDFDNFRCKITAGAEATDKAWSEKEEIDIGFKEPTNFDFMDYNVFE